MVSIRQIFADDFGASLGWVGSRQISAGARGPQGPQGDGSAVGKPHARPACDWPEAHWLAEDCAVGLQLSKFQEQYELRGQISAGNFGVVYDARIVSTGESISVKVVKDNDSGVQEAHIQSALSHRHILCLLDAWVSPSYTVLVLPRASTSLHRHVCVHADKIDVTQVEAVSRQMCNAVTYMHQKKILHRDLHSGNILVSPGATPGDVSPVGAGIHIEVSDFGKACVVPPDGSMVLPMCYRPPELLFARGSVLRRSGDMLSGSYMYRAAEFAEYRYNVDIWPLGCLIVFVSCGQPPFGWSHEGPAYAKQLLSTMGAPPARLVSQMNWQVLQTSVGVEFLQIYGSKATPPIWQKVKVAKLVAAVFQYTEAARPSAQDMVESLQQLPV